MLFCKVDGEEREAAAAGDQAQFGGAGGALPARHLRAQRKGKGESQMIRQRGLG